ncbi:SinR family protein [bacterium]|nr:MAG: SinR family protein [bacterium]
MKTYLIGYDLRKKGEDDYKDLKNAIKKLSGKWWHNLDSTWIVKSDESATEIRNKLKAHIDSNDKLLVVRLSGEGAWKGFSSTGSQCLLNNL